MLFRTLDHIFGTQTKVRLLRALVPLDSPVSGREAQRLAGIKSVSGAGRALDDLTDLGILQRDEAGGAHLYRMNRRHVLAHALVALFRAEARQMAALRKVVRKKLESANLLGAVCSVVIFGSTARGEARAHSDLDLLVIVDKEDAVDPARATLLDSDGLLRRQLGVRTSPYVLSREQAAARRRDGDPLMAAVEAEGHTLLGEPFGEVVSG